MEGHTGRAPASCRCGCVLEHCNPWVAFQQGANGLPLATGTAAVDDPQVEKAQPEGFIQIAADDIGHFPRREAVEIQYVGDGELDGLPVGEFVLARHLFEQLEEGQEKGVSVIGSGYGSPHVEPYQGPPGADQVPGDPNAAEEFLIETRRLIGCPGGVADQL